jgi:FixJ family two-component response regulator
LIYWEWLTCSESVARNPRAYTQVSFPIPIRDAICSQDDGDAMGSWSPRQERIALSKPPLVAIVDDDASVRATTDSLVRSLGYIVHTFASAEEFLRSNRLDDLSCVIADVQMPGMSGVELQAHLLSQGYRVPFIFFTAFPDERIRAQALRAGAICYLTKPFDGDSLVQGLQAALKKHDN